jgi:hypothetical protein
MFPNKSRDMAIATGKVGLRSFVCAFVHQTHLIAIHFLFLKSPPSGSE